MANTEVSDKTKSLKNATVNLNIDAIVEKARAFYGKGEKGMAKQISTGVSMVRPSADKDFVMWTGSDYWQRLTGLRGLPFGKIVQVAGRPDSGKSSTAAIFMVSAQASGQYVILWDAEQKFQPDRYDKQLGGDASKLLVVDTNSIQEGTKAVAYLIDSIKSQDPAAKILLCFDSVGAALSGDETQTEDENMTKMPMRHAKEINWSMKKFNRLINHYQNRETGEHSIAVLVINQVYAQLNSPGYKEKGGEGLFYLSSLILQMSRKKDLIKTRKGDKIKYGIVSRVRVKKNHLFNGEECLSECDVVVGACGIQSVDEVKKKETDVSGWDAPEEDDGEE